MTFLFGSKYEFDATLCLQIKCLTKLVITINSKLIYQQNKQTNKHFDQTQYIFLVTIAILEELIIFEY